MVEAKKSTTTKKTTREEPVEEQNINIVTPDQDNYISVENDNVRIYTSKKEILPGVEIDIQTFKVFLDDSKETFLEFREPDTGECLESIENAKNKAREAARKGKTSEVDETSMMIKFICSLSIGEIPVTNSLLKNLPVKYQYRIIRTIEKITEGNGSKLTI